MIYEGGSLDLRDTSKFLEELEVTMTGTEEIKRQKLQLEDDRKSTEGINDNRKKEEAVDSVNQKITFEEKSARMKRELTSKGRKLFSV